MSELSPKTLEIYNDFNNGTITDGELQKHKSNFDRFSEHRIGEHPDDKEKRLNKKKKEENDLSGEK